MFCDISPTCYKIALQKEIIKRHIKNFLRHERYADTRQSEPLPYLVADCSSHLIKRGKGIDPVLQENKAVNIKLANARMNGILIRPGETFSFWHLVGKTTKQQGLSGWPHFGAQPSAAGYRRRAVQSGQYHPPGGAA